MRRAIPTRETRKQFAKLMSTKCCENNYPIKNVVVPTLKTEENRRAFKKRFRTENRKKGKEIKSQVWIDASKKKTFLKQPAKVIFIKKKNILWSWDLMSFSYTRKIKSEVNLSIFIKRQLIILDFGAETRAQKKFSVLLSWWVGNWKPRKK